VVTFDARRFPATTALRDKNVDAAGGQLHRNREPHRAGADNQDCCSQRTQASAPRALPGTSYMKPYQTDGVCRAWKAIRRTIAGADRRPPASGVGSKTVYDY
jgi:hypothetical protein